MIPIWNILNHTMGNKYRNISVPWENTFFTQFEEKPFSGGGEQFNFPLMGECAYPHFQVLILYTGNARLNIRKVFGIGVTLCWRILEKSWFYHSLKENGKFKRVSTWGIWKYLQKNIQENGEPW